LFFFGNDRIDGELRANHQVKALSGGELDLSGIIFIALLGFGLWELAIGNFKRPPWYTAFWSAFRLFSKTIIDELNRNAS
jgi:hypothetical protein